MWKVPGEDPDGVRVKIDRSRDRESCALEPKTEPAATTEEVNAGQALSHSSFDRLSSPQPNSRKFRSFSRLKAEWPRQLVWVGGHDEARPRPLSTAIQSARGACGRVAQFPVGFSGVVQSCRNFKLYRNE
jgi:hypothetical protein